MEKQRIHSFILWDGNGRMESHAVEIGVTGVVEQSLSVWHDGDGDVYGAVQCERDPLNQRVVRTEFSEHGEMTAAVGYDARLEGAEPEILFGSQDTVAYDSRGYAATPRSYPSIFSPRGRKRLLSPTVGGGYMDTFDMSYDGETPIQATDADARSEVLRLKLREKRLTNAVVGGTWNDLIEGL